AQSSRAHDTNDKTDTPVRRDTGTAKPTSSEAVSKMDFHPALAVSNIKNHIPMVLEIEKDQYGTWAELFSIHTIHLLFFLFPPLLYSFGNINVKV
ncbi:polynucleotidyl transferase, partial [Trifolium medium]|nr:polynucleotidyl transferase [Trifolium medium]